MHRSKELSHVSQVTQTETDNGVQVVDATIALVSGQPLKEVQTVRIWDLKRTSDRVACVQATEGPSLA